MKGFGKMEDINKIVFIGDSITYGYGVYKEKRWTNILNLDRRIEIINKGVNGDTTAGILSRSFEDVIKQCPKYVIILAGTNDLIIRRSLNSVKDNITILIKEFKEYNIIPVLGTPIPICTLMAKMSWAEDVDYEKVNEEIYDYRNWLIKYGDTNKIDVVDFFFLFQSVLKNNESSLIYIDGIHPTTYGHKLMADCAANRLKHIIK